MMKAGFISLTEAAAKFAFAASELPKVNRQIIEAACRIVRDEAKGSLGTYQKGWPPLQPETIARKATGDSPLLETGEMRDSIEFTVTSDTEGQLRSALPSSRTSAWTPRWRRCVRGWLANLQGNFPARRLPTLRLPWTGLLPASESDGRRLRRRLGARWRPEGGDEKKRRPLSSRRGLSDCGHSREVRSGDRGPPIGDLKQADTGGLGYGGVYYSGLPFWYGQAANVSGRTGSFERADGGFRVAALRHAATGALGVLPSIP
jgi:hypothetical protein